MKCTSSNGILFNQDKQRVPIRPQVLEAFLISSAKVFCPNSSGVGGSETRFSVMLHSKSDTKTPSPNEMHYIHSSSVEHDMAQESRTGTPSGWSDQDPDGSRWDYEQDDLVFPTNTITDRVTRVNAEQATIIFPHPGLPYIGKNIYLSCDGVLNSGALSGYALVYGKRVKLSIEEYTFAKGMYQYDE